MNGGDKLSGILRLKVLRQCKDDEEMKGEGSSEERRRRKLHRRMLKNAGLPQHSTEFLPERKRFEACPLGEQTEEVFRDFTSRVENGNKAQENEGGKSERTELDVIFGKECEIENLQDVPVRDKIALLHTKDPSQYVPPTFTLFKEQQFFDGSRVFDAPVDEIPGFAPQKTKLERGRGGQYFFNYLGSWEKGKLTGGGVFVFADSGCYVGSWKNSYPHGEGRANYGHSNHQGVWSCGLKHGPGRYISDSGNTYEGAFAEGKVTGFGKLCTTSGFCYEGFFVDGLFHGKGKIISPLGYRFEGTFAEGLILGAGVLTHPDGRKVPKIWKPARTFQAVILNLIRTNEKNLEANFRLRRRLNAVLDDMNVRREVQAARERNARLSEVQHKKEREEANRERHEHRARLRAIKEARKLEQC